MSLESIWEDLVNTRDKHRIIELKEPIVIPNSSKCKEYTLTHKYSDSGSAFIGQDDDGSKYHIKIFSLSSFDEVKSIYKNLKLLETHKEELKLLPVHEIIEFYENNRWVMLLITEYLEGFTLEELTEALHSKSVHLAKDYSIYIFLSILDIIKTAHDQALIVSCMPDNLFFTWDDDRNNNLIRDTDKYIVSRALKLELKILCTSKQWLRCGKSKLEKLYPGNKTILQIDEMIWGAGLCLYAFVSSQPLSALPPLNESNEVERSELLKLHYEDETLWYIIKHTLRNTKPTNFLLHPYIQTWRALIQDNWDQVSTCNIMQIAALISGLTFETLKCQLLAMRKILIIAQENVQDVYKGFKKNEYLFVFIELCLKFDWHEFPQLLNSVFLIIIQKAASKNFKQKLVSMNIFSILSISIILEVNTELLCEFLNWFFNDDTLTVLQIVWDSGFVGKLIDKPNKSPTELGFIKSTMCYYGPNSIDLIKKVYETMELSEALLSKNLLEIPYYFKLDKSQLVVQIMQKIVERNGRNQADSVLDVLKSTVLTLAEILCFPKLLQYHHILGECPSKSNKLFLSDLGRIPLLVRCKNCSKSFCVMCKDKYHAGHDIQYVLYQSPLSRCNTEASKETDIDIDVFKLPLYPQKIYLIDSFDQIYKSNTCFYTTKAVSITTCDPLKIPANDQQQTLVYFEVKINKAGLLENIVLGISGTGVTYRSTDGKICLKDVPVAEGPRFGSYDHVGMGVTSTSKVYVTYNGLLNWPMVDCELSEVMKPFVELNSEYCEVEIKLRSWLFEPTNDRSSSQDFVNKELLCICDKLLMLLCKYVRKFYRKQKKNNQAKDVMDKYIEVLKTARRFDLVEKTEVKKSKLWPR